MKDTKLHTLIDALQEQELKLIENILKVEKRKSLLLLFQFAKKKQTLKWSKEVLFYKIFQKKYTEDKDYLWRNELRLLVEKIESILIEEQVKNQLKEDQIFYLKQQLQLYKRLDLFKLYETLWKETKSLAIANYQYHEVILLNTEYFEFIQFHIRDYQQRLEIYDNLIQENQQITTQFFVHQFAFTTMLEGSSNKLRLEYYGNPEVKIPSTEINIKLNKYYNDLDKYYLLINEWFPLQSKGRTDILLQALELLEHCDKSKAIIQKEYLRVLYLIATDFSMSANFEKANVYFEKIFQEIPENKLHNVAYYYYNYAINITKLEQYTKAIEIIQIAEKHIKPNNDFLKEKYILLKVVCYMFLNDNKNLKALIPSDFSTLLPEQRIYFSFVNAIYHIIANNFELASEEINNLLRSKLIKETDTHFLAVAKFFNSALTEINKVNKLSLPPTAKSRLIKQAEKMEKDESALVNNYMPFKWLKSALLI
ncbi:MAG: hypothetical protein KDD21_11405 [Bacteroidetes bacterium]|nr:hypothetical protein [Bacteroidota bacterium]